jgi:hypothetical protein
MKFSDRHYVSRETALSYHTHRIHLKNSGLLNATARMMLVSNKSLASFSSFLQVLLPFPSIVMLQTNPTTECSFSVIWILKKLCRITVGTQLITFQWSGRVNQGSWCIRRLTLSVKSITWLLLFSFKMSAQFQVNSIHILVITIIPLRALFHSRFHHFHRKQPWDWRSLL